MTLDSGDFSKATIQILAQRSANQCCNPECNAVTSGPAEDHSRATIVGEAAHIYGARIGAARYDEDMTQQQRSAITNAIWLCRNCHKVVDANPIYFSPAILFEWRNSHESRISKHIGKQNDQIKRQIAEKEVISFGDLNYRARQVLLDRPDGWEYLLTAEVLASKCKPILVRWEALKKGLYAKQISRVSDKMVLLWYVDRMKEIGSLIPALTALCNNEFCIAWGLPGQPGSPDLIVNACRLFAENCEQILLWEERVRFTALSEEYTQLQKLFYGVGGRALEQVAQLPAELSKLFEGGLPEGSHDIEIIIDLPQNFEIDCFRIVGELEQLIIKNM